MAVSNGVGLLIILFLLEAAVDVVDVVIVVKVLVLLLYIQINVYSRCICSFTCDIFSRIPSFRKGVTLFPHFLVSIFKDSRLEMFLAFYDSILLN